MKNNLMDLTDNLYKINRIINAQDRKSRDYGNSISLYPNEAHTLKNIAECEGISMIDLTSKMFRTKGATSIVVEQLVKKNLLKKVKNDLDNRIFNLYLTDLGVETNQVHLSYDSTALNRLTEKINLNEDDIDIANAVLLQLINHFGDKIIL